MRKNKTFFAKPIWEIYVYVKAHGIWLWAFFVIIFLSVRHKRHDIEKFTKEGLTNYKRKSKKRLQKKKFTKEKILQKKTKHKREKFLNLQKRKRKQIFTKDKKQHKIFYTKDKAKQIFYKRGTEKRNAKRKDRRTRRESPWKQEKSVLSVWGMSARTLHTA